MTEATGEVTLTGACCTLLEDKALSADQRELLWQVAAPRVSSLPPEYVAAESLDDAGIAALKSLATSEENVDESTLAVLLLIHASEKERSPAPKSNTAFNIAAMLLSIPSVNGDLAVSFAKEHLLRVDDSDSTVWYMFSSSFAANSKEKCVEVLGQLKEQLRGKSAGHARCCHLLSMLTQEGESCRKASSEYVRAVFDDLAPVFEKRLKGLSYDVPSRLATLVTGRVFISSAPAIIDLGCGTGLVGESLMPLVRNKTTSRLVLEADLKVRTFHAETQQSHNKTKQAKPNF